MSRSFIFSAAVVAAAAVMPQAPAMAQYDDAIIVSSVPAPRISPHDGLRRELQVVAQVVVPTHDLDLRTEYGRDVLDRRVSLAATQACDQLTGVDAVGVGGNPVLEAQDCRLRAVKGARSQVRDAILLNS